MYIFFFKQMGADEKHLQHPKYIKIKTKIVQNAGGT
jgi:hypothetical protein